MFIARCPGASAGTRWVNIEAAGSSWFDACRKFLHATMSGQRMIAMLEPLFRGDFEPHGETLQCAAEVPPEALHVADLLRSHAAFSEVLRRHAAHRNAQAGDPRAVASSWSRAYLAALLPPVVAAASVLQHAFPVAAEHVWVRLDANGSPISFHIRHLGQSMLGSGTAERYAVLLWLHLQPLFAALNRHTRLAPKILWGNAARHLEPILEQALLLTGGAPSIAGDKEQLLHKRIWQQEFPAAPAQKTSINPLYAPQREIGWISEGLHEPAKLHRQCCLYHLLPGESYCAACPLSPRHRKVRAEAPDA